MGAPRALAFDVFGTVVDWRRGIARESAGFLAAMEYGGAPAPDRDRQQSWEWAAGSLVDLAGRLGC